MKNGTTLLGEFGIF